jgi:hypothetical protein
VVCGVSTAIHSSPTPTTTTAEWGSAVRRAEQSVEVKKKRRAAQGEKERERDDAVLTLQQATRRAALSGAEAREQQRKRERERELGAVQCRGQRRSGATEREGGSLIIYPITHTPRHHSPPPSSSRPSPFLLRAPAARPLRSPLAHQPPLRRSSNISCAWEHGSERKKGRRKVTKGKQREPKD